MPEKSPEWDNDRVEKGTPLSFSIDFSILSDRQISGCAHYEAPDLENEVIEINAIRKALDCFMQHPILHYQHTERPIGTITKAEIVEKGLYIECSIYDTPDTDDVWDEIRKGFLNKFSIYGRRLKGNDQCRIPSENRISPCVTKAITLYSISAVGNNAINQMTFLEFAKALRGDIVTDEDIENVIEKAEDAPTQEAPLLKADTNTSSILERLAGVEQTLQGLVDSDKQVHESMGETAKAEEVEEPGETEEKKCGCSAMKATVDEEEDDENAIVKASVVDLDIITKAEMVSIQKAFDQKIAALESRISEMEEQTIQKGGQVVIIADQLTDSDKSAFNPLIANAKALGGI